MKQVSAKTQEQLNNISILNSSFDFEDGRITRQAVITFCKRARIDVCCDLIDTDVQDAFYEYYGYLLVWSSNRECFIIN